MSACSQANSYLAEFKYIKIDKAKFNHDGHDYNVFHHIGEDIAYINEADKTTMLERAWDIAAKSNASYYSNLYVYP